MGSWSLQRRRDSSSEREGARIPPLKSLVLGNWSLLKRRRNGDREGGDGRGGTGAQQLRTFRTWTLSCFSSTLSTRVPPLKILILLRSWSLKQRRNGGKEEGGIRTLPLKAPYTIGQALCAGRVCTKARADRWSYWSRRVFRPQPVFLYATKTRGEGARLPLLASSPPTGWT